MTDAKDDRNAALMTSLVIGLVQAAYTQLGKIKNEMTGKIEKNLDAARVTIDTIAALELRTRGNRTESETQVLERALAELRLNYVDEAKKSAGEQMAAATPSAAPEPPPTPDA
jgi:hypothetical protein